MIFHHNQLSSSFEAIMKIIIFRILNIESVIREFSKKITVITIRINGIHHSIVKIIVLNELRTFRNERKRERGREREKIIFNYLLFRF